MTKSQILEALIDISPGIFEMTVFSKFLNTDIKVDVMPAASNYNTPEITDYLAGCINDLIQYDGEAREKILNDIYADYKNAIQVTDYGMVSDDLLKKHNGNYEAANQEYFNINSADEAFNALTFKYAMVVEYSSEFYHSDSPRYFGLFFSRPWDNEHELQLAFENGKYNTLE